MSRIRLHVVDDDRDAVDLLRGYLLHAECELACSYSGREALPKLRESPPDLVLLDVQMADLDGFETLAAMRVDARLRQLPVIFLSSFDRPNLKVRALEMGADDYVVKPCHPAELLARIRAVLRRRLNEASLEGKFAGDLSHFPLATLLQSLAIAGRDATVCFPERRREPRLPEGPRDPSLEQHRLWAWIALAEGLFVDGCIGSARGKEALLRLLLCTSGQFETRFGELIEKVDAGPAIPVDALLLGLMVAIDEVRELIAPVADFEQKLRLTELASPETRAVFLEAPATPRQILVHSCQPFTDTATLLVNALHRGEVVPLEEAAP